MPGVQCCNFSRVSNGYYTCECVRSPRHLLPSLLHIRPYYTVVRLTNLEPPTKDTYSIVVSITRRSIIQCRTSVLYVYCDVEKFLTRLSVHLQVRRPFHHEGFSRVLGVNPEALNVKLPRNGGETLCADSVAKNFTKEWWRKLGRAQ